MEEQRQRQEEEQRRAQADSATEAGVTVTPAATATASTAEPLSDEAMLERALALSTETPVKRSRVRYFYYSFYQNLFY